MMLFDFERPVLSQIMLSGHVRWQKQNLHRILSRNTSSEIGKKIILADFTAFPKPYSGTLDGTLVGVDFEWQ